MKCAYFDIERVVKNGKGQLSAQRIQRYLCHDCERRFNERSGTLMSRLRTAPETIALALKVRSEGLGSQPQAECWENQAEALSTGKTVYPPNSYIGRHPHHKGAK
jgi:transposase-like protein